MVASAAVPDAERPHGEVTLLVRAGESVIETFLHSRVLRRVVAEIALKEEAAWPPHSRFAADRARYVRALERAERAVWRKHQRLDERRTHVPKLLIEITVSASAAEVALFELPVAASAERASLARRTLLERLSLAREYVERSFYLIAQDALGIAPADVARRVEAGGGWAPPLPDA